ncbi:MAG TPA: M20/M25/M40 family metallo-hydrolase [Myxococcaceae bacterium]|nr:M20/M25/M40 family metallo-hydrolase [Myxococcaceae bacterium]
MMTLTVATLASLLMAQAPREPDWSAVETETMQHFQALLRFDTSDPPGAEKPAADYLKQILEREGIPVQVFALEPNRPNVVARLKGNGAKRPILIMGHTDVVNVDASKWTFPPFSATRNQGYVYGRGSVDDKDNVVTGLMTMLLLKRLNRPLDRDVIFLAEAGEEGSTRVGIQYMVNQHFKEIDAEYCLAEGGGVTRKDGKVGYASVQTVEKIPRAIELTARGISGHGSVPLQTNAVVRLANAVAKFATWRAPIRLNPTTRAYFERLASVSSPEDAARYLNVISRNPRRVAAADQYFVEHEPRFAAMLRTSVSPNIVQGGYRLNVIPSEAKASLDVRLLPDEDPEAFLEMIRGVIKDPSVQVAYAPRDVRPPGSARLDSEAFKVLEAAVSKHYQAVTLPALSTGATDMSYLRAKGVQCYGIGPAVDVEDGPKGFGAHSDQERILEAELHRFVRFHWDVVVDLAGSGRPAKALSQQ